MIVGVVFGIGAVFLIDRTDTSEVQVAATTSTSQPSTATTLTPTTVASTSTSIADSTTTSGVPERESGNIPGWTVGQPWGSTTGLTMFRGNPTRTNYGTGPISSDPAQAWQYPDSAMCSLSSAGGETKQWCGMGWTGQPVVHERSDGKTEVIFGAYDRAVHFVDGDTGENLRPPYVTGDIIKGSVTLDPDGYPLLYFGSRDNKLRILALDRDQPEELWSIDASAVRGIWNNDWDSNPVVIDDILYEGGENGWFFAFQLHRQMDSDGLVMVDPVTVFSMAGYDQNLIAKSGRNVSIEASVVAFEERIYFANSGGRVVGLDVSNIRDGEAPIVFDYYAGGDIDATMVVDQDGFLYVSIEHEPSQMNSTELARNTEVGQLVKLDPYADDDPRLWGIDLTEGFVDAGLWSTPALYGRTLYVNTQAGELIVVDADTGEIVWSDPVGFHSWSSPVVIDDTLVVATCSGELRGYSLEDPHAPALLWALNLGGACLEATPAVWNGTIYIGSRDGFIRAFR